MAYDSIIWDLDDDPDGNVQHCAGHGVTKEEVGEAFENMLDTDFSRVIRPADDFRRDKRRPTHCRDL